MIVSWNSCKQRHTPASFRRHPTSVMARATVVLAVALVVVAALTPSASATNGVDVSVDTYSSAWQCLLGEGYSYAIVRAYQSIGQPDPAAPHTIYNAWDGGMKAVDIYVFPCFSCGNPEGQISATVSHLAQYNISSHSPYGPPHSFGTIWLDIEGPQYWGDQSANIAFIKGLIAGAQAHGLTIGVYTSESQWTPITGGWTGASQFPLWYAHYDYQQNFDDFTPFGGWSSPAMKQYNGNQESCGAGIDMNWYP